MKLTSISTIAFVIISTIILFAKPLYATYPGANGIISYSLANGGYVSTGLRSLQSINPDGTGLAHLSHSPQIFQFLHSWSSDGSSYVYVKNVGNLEIWIANINGSRNNKVTSIRSTTVPSVSLSPDGQKIAFEDCDSKSCDIYTINSDGTNRQRLTFSQPWGKGSPSWSPDGLKLAYTSTEAGSFDVWVMNYDGTGAKQLTSDSGIEGGSDWSPDGSKIAYRGPGLSGIYIMNADGSNKSLLPNTSDAGSPTWSPDGTMIIFDCDKGYGGYYLGICKIDADGSNRVLIAAKAKQADGRLPRWQPIPKAHKNISLGDTGFVPSITHAHQGWKVRWNFLGENPQAVVDDLAMGMFGSGMEPKGGAYATTFYDAGIYQTFDPTSKRSGSISVPVKVTPTSGPVGTAFTVKWSTRNAPAGKVFDVQEKRPDSTAWLYYLRGVKSKSSTVTLTQAGTYLYRARLRGRTGTVYWSPSASITVE